MTASKFLKQKIDFLLKSIPSLKCEYDFKDLSNIHFIKVVPQVIYDTNELYFEIENQIYSEFVENYPDQGLSFISEDAIVVLDNPKYTKIGISYNVIEWSSLSIHNALIHFTEFEGVISELESSSKVIFSTQKVSSLLQGSYNNIDPNLLGENTFAMAA